MGVGNRSWKIKKIRVNGFHEEYFLFQAFFSKSSIFRDKTEKLIFWVFGGKPQKSQHNTWGREFQGHVSETLTNTLNQSSVCYQKMFLSACYLSNWPRLWEIIGQVRQLRPMLQIRSAICRSRLLCFLLQKNRW